MTVTLLQLITDSLNELGVYSPNETVSAADSAQMLTILQRLVDEWNNERLYVSQIIPATLTLSIGVASYTAGPGGVLNCPAPDGISYGSGTGTVTISAVNTELNVISGLEWSMIESVSPGTGTPNAVYFNPDYPLGTLNFTPTPNAIGTASIPFIYSGPFYNPLTNLATAYSFAEGVQDALVHNLSVMAKPYFATAQLDPSIAALAVTTKNYLRYSNRSSRALLNRDLGRMTTPKGQQTTAGA